MMKVKLKARVLWVVVDSGGVEPQEDMMALDVLANAVPVEMAATLPTRRRPRRRGMRSRSCGSVTTA